MATRSVKQDREAARLKVEQMRKQQARAARRRAQLFWGGALSVVLVIMGVVGVTIWRSQANKPSLSAVKSFTYSGGTHTEEQVSYKENPPVGGEHSNTWLNCGIYDKPVPEENAVHALEHGAVWVTYNPALPAADIEKLRDDLPSTYVVLSPFEGLPAPVVASAWGKQIQLTGVTDPRLPLFISTYRQGPQTPEPGAACTGGTDGPGQVAAS